MPMVFPRFTSDFLDWKNAKIMKTIPMPPMTSVRLLKTSSDFGSISGFSIKLKPVVVNPEVLSK